MRHFILILALWIIWVSVFCLTVYDIQYTSNPNGNSPYMNQTVTVEGIVSGVGYGVSATSPDPKFFITDPGGGPWSGIYVYKYGSGVTVGDYVRVTGMVQEYYNFTEIAGNPTVQIISNGNPLPEPALITTGTLANSTTAEQWEGCLVKVENVTVTSMPDNYNQFNVNDGSGNCQIDDNFFGLGYSWTGLALNQTWVEIRGIVDFYSNQYALCPRNASDMIQVDNLSNASIRLQNVTAQKGQIVPINVYTSKLRPAWNVTSYQFKVYFNSDLVHFEGVDTTGTLSKVEPTFNLSANTDTVTISIDSTAAMTSDVNDKVLIKLLFRPISYGEVVLDLIQFRYNSTNITNLTDGKITIPISEKIAWLKISNTKNEKNIFNPWLNEKIRIDYGCRVESGIVTGKAILRIYDAQGRMVATLVNKNITSSNGMENFQWDGRDRNRNLLPIGLYYCHLEIIDRSTGNSEVTVQPIIIASKLK